MRPTRGWPDVDGLRARLPDAVRGEAHDGSPAWYAGRHAFARWRRDDALAPGDLVQLWSGALDLGDQLADRPVTFPVVHTFSYRVSVWCVLGGPDGLDLRELAELLLDSYRIRGGRRRAAAVEEARYLAGLA